LLVDVAASKRVLNGNLVELAMIVSLGFFAPPFDPVAIDRYREGGGCGERRGKGLVTQKVRHVGLPGRFGREPRGGKGVSLVVKQPRDQSV
jgi:hypothetical protein